MAVTAVYAAWAIAGYNNTIMVPCYSGAYKGQCHKLKYS